MKWRRTWGKVIKFTLFSNCILISFIRVWQFNTPFIFISLNDNFYSLIVCQPTIVGSCLRTFRHSILVPFSGSSCSLKMEPAGCPETSVNNHVYTLWNKPRILKKSSALRQKPEILFLNCNFIGVIIKIKGHAVAQLVEALRCKSEVRWFDSRWCHWNFSLT